MVAGQSIWNAEDVLTANRNRLIKQLRQSLCAYEARYELPSEKVHDELVAGRIRETAEVCSWLVDWETYQALIGEHPARLD
jgi:hypothetical protein